MFQIYKSKKQNEKKRAREETLNKNPFFSVIVVERERQTERVN